MKNAPPLPLAMVPAFTAAGQVVTRLDDAERTFPYRGKFHGQGCSWASRYCAGTGLSPLAFDRLTLTFQKASPMASHACGISAAVSHFPASWGLRALKHLHWVPNTFLALTLFRIKPTQVTGDSVTFAWRTLNGTELGCCSLQVGSGCGETGACRNEIYLRCQSCSVTCSRFSLSRCSGS